MKPKDIAACQALRVTYHSHTSAFKLNACEPWAVEKCDDDDVRICGFRQRGPTWSRSPGRFVTSRRRWRRVFDLLCMTRRQVPIRLRKGRGWSWLRTQRNGIKRKFFFVLNFDHVAASKCVHIREVENMTIEQIDVCRGYLCVSWVDPSSTT